jgi:hypothetical protein
MDLVITIFDSSKTQIAQNDDPFPRDTQDSKLYTVLPEDGDYYIKVEEFCETDLSGGNCPADYFDGIFEYGYAVNVFQIDGVDDMGSPFFPSYTKHPRARERGPHERDRVPLHPRRRGGPDPGLLLHHRPG